MRRRLIIEAYGPKIFYILGTNNVAADALSRLPIMDEITSKSSLLNDIHKKYARTKDTNYECLLDAGVIVQAQRNELSV